MGFVAWQGIRQRWPTLLLLTVALGLTGAVVLASVAGSRRGREALDEFVEFHGYGNLEAFVDPALPVDEQVALLRDMIAASGQEDYALRSPVITALPDPDATSGPLDIAGGSTDGIVAEAYIDDLPEAGVKQSLVIDGELPLDPGEAAVNETFVHRRDVAVGDTITVALFGQEDTDRIGNGEALDPRERVEVTVGAVIREPVDLARSPQAQPGTIFESDEARMLLEPTFWAEHGSRSANYGIGVSLEVPDDDLDAVTAAMVAVGGDDALVNTAGSEELGKVAPVGDAIDLESNAVLASAGVVLVFALVLLGSALARAAGEDAEDRVTLEVLGLTGRQRAAIQLWRGGLVTGAGAVLAVIGAIVASTQFPIGLARDAEIDPGLDLDTPVLVLGGLAFALLVGARIVQAGWSDRRRDSRARPTVGAGVLPLTPLGLGARASTEGLGRRGAGTSRAALIAAITGVAALAAATTYAASVDDLIDDPERQGWVWDVVVGNYSGDVAPEEGRDALAANPDVKVFAAYQTASADVDGQTVSLAEFEPDAVDLVPVLLEGRAPLADDEIALGRGTLDQLDKNLGDSVEVSATGGAVDATIVGVIVAPATITPAMDLDSGGSITFGLSRLIYPGASQNIAAFLVAFADDVDPVAARARLGEDFPGTVVGPMQPLDLTDLGRVRTVPFLLAGLLGAMALVSVVVTLATAARRRRREIAVLRSLGLARGQLRRVLTGEATMFVGLALVIGLPLGVVAGRLAWTLAADGLGTEVGPTVPLLTIGIATLVVLLAVNLYAQGLATVVARRKPGGDLRTE